MAKVNSSKAEFWSNHIASSQQFKGSKQSYCDTHGLKLSTFYQWKKKIEGPKKPVSRSAFLEAVIQEPISRTDSRGLGRFHLTEPALADARWVAEVLAHMLEVRR